VGSSAAVSVTVSNAPGDTTPPTTAITSPANGAIVSAPSACRQRQRQRRRHESRVLPRQRSAEHVDHLAVFVELDTATSANGAHTLTSKAYDGRPTRDVGAGQRHVSNGSPSISSG